MKFLLLSATYLTQSCIFLAAWAQKYWKLFLTCFILSLRFVASVRTSTWLSPDEFTLVLRRSVFKFWLYWFKLFLFSQLTRNYLWKLVHKVYVHHFKIKNFSLRRVLLLNDWMKPRRKWWRLLFKGLQLYLVYLFRQKSTPIYLSLYDNKCVLEILFLCNYSIYLFIHLAKGSIWRRVGMKENFIDFLWRLSQFVKIIFDGIEIAKLLYHFIIIRKTKN